MTKAAQHFGKELKKFWENLDTSEYLRALSAQIGPNQPIYEASRGRHGGTWAHPKLAVFFARWLDVRFAVWCDAMIEDILKGKAEVVITKPQESAVMALPQNYAASLRALADAWEAEEKARLKNSLGNLKQGMDVALNLPVPPVAPSKAPTPREVAFSWQE